MTARKHVDNGTSCLCRLPLLEISIEEVMQEVDYTRVTYRTILPLVLHSRVRDWPNWPMGIIVLSRRGS